MRRQLIGLLCLCCLHLQAAELNIFGEVVDRNRQDQDLTAQRQVYLSLFRHQEAEADSRGGRAALLRTLWSRYSEDELAPIRAYVKVRLRELIDDPSEALHYEILLGLLQEDLDRSPRVAPELLLQRAGLLQGQIREVRGEAQQRVAVELIQTWNDLAAHAATIRDYEHAEEWFDEVADLSRRLRDRDGYRIAKGLADRMEDSGERYQELLEEQAALGDGGEPAIQAELARGFFMEQDATAAWRHARQGGDAPMARLARLDWRTRRWDGTATATGLTMMDADRLRHATRRGDRATVRQILLLAISDPVLNEAALPLFQELETAAAIDGVLLVGVEDFAQTMRTAAGEGGTISIDAAALQDGLQIVRDQLDGRLETHERVALLDAGLRITTSIAARGDKLPQVLTLAARVDHKHWQTARDELAMDWPEELLVLSNPAGGDEAAYLRQGWEQVFDHENLPIPSGNLNEKNVRIENGIAVIALPAKDQIWSSMPYLGGYDEIRYRFRFDSESGYDGYWYFGCAVDHQKQAVRVLVSQEQIAVATGRTPEKGDLGTFPLRRGWNEVHIAYLAEQDHSVVVTVNGSPAEPLAGFGSKPGMWFLANPLRNGTGERTLYLQSLLGRKRAAAD
ncbi:MAG: hypothetical protein ACOCXJ_01170 [Planctomycetota bacterium]